MPITSDEPLITIGVTCFNARRTIARALKSAAAQDWRNTEILVVDDGSTDGSQEQVHVFAGEHRAVRLIVHPENRGVAAARNTILAEACGEWIAFFDDDDESAPDRLRRQHRRLVEYERATGVDRVICHTSRLQRFPDGTARHEPTVGMDVTPAVDGESMAELILIGRPPRGGSGSCAACSQMARKRVYEALGGFDAKLARGEDTDFNLRAALAGAHFAGIASPLVTQHMNFSAEKDFEREREYVRYWIAKHREPLQRLGWYEFSVRWFEGKFDYLQGRRGRFAARMTALALRYPCKTLRRLWWSWPHRNQYARAIALAETARVPSDHDR